MIQYRRIRPMTDGRFDVVVDVPLETLQNRLRLLFSSRVSPNIFFLRFSRSTDSFTISFHLSTNSFAFFAISLCSYFFNLFTVFPKPFTSSNVALDIPLISSNRFNRSKILFTSFLSIDSFNSSYTFFTSSIITTPFKRSNGPVRRHRCERNIILSINILYFFFFDLVDEKVKRREREKENETEGFVRPPKEKESFGAKKI